MHKLSPPFLLLVLTGKGFVLDLNCSAQMVHTQPASSQQGRAHTLTYNPKLSPFARLQVLSLPTLLSPIQLLCSKSPALLVAPVCLLTIASYGASQTQ